MAEDFKDGMDELRLPFVFVPHGAPDPVEFMRHCAEPLRIPATFRPDPQPFHPHPDAYLPTGTQTAEFPHGTPACLGLIAPGYRPHSRFPHGGAPPYTDPKYDRTDPIAEYHRLNRMADEAARNYGSPDHAELTQAMMMKTAEIVRRHPQTVEAVLKAVDGLETGIGSARTESDPTWAVIPISLTPEKVSSHRPATLPTDPKQELLEQNVADLANVIDSEARTVEKAQTAVGWVVINRMRRNNAIAVHDVWRGFAHQVQKPDTKALDLARRLLLEHNDPTGGITHFYTPSIMPKKGDEKPGSAGYRNFIRNDIDGGLESVPGVKDNHGNAIENYRPSYANDSRFRQVFVAGVKDKDFKFYKALGTGVTR